MCKNSTVLEGGEVVAGSIKEAIANRGDLDPTNDDKQGQQKGGQNGSQRMCRSFMMLEEGDVVASSCKVAMANMGNLGPISEGRLERQVVDVQELCDARRGRGCGKRQQGLSFGNVVFRVQFIQFRLGFQFLFLFSKFEYVGRIKFGVPIHIRANTYFYIRISIRKTVHLHVYGFSDVDVQVYTNSNVDSDDLDIP